MPGLAGSHSTAGDGDGLILTPSKLRLHSYVFAPYITSVWLPNGILALLLLFKASTQRGPQPGSALFGRLTS